MVSYIRQRTRLLLLALWTVDLASFALPAVSFGILICFTEYRAGEVGLQWFSAIMIIAVILLALAKYYVTLKKLCETGNIFVPITEIAPQMYGRNITFYTISVSSFSKNNVSVITFLGGRAAIFVDELFWKNALSVSEWRTIFAHEVGHLRAYDTLHSIVRRSIWVLLQSFLCVHALFIFDHVATLFSTWVLILLCGGACSQWDAKAHACVREVRADMLAVLATGLPSDLATMLEHFVHVDPVMSTRIRALKWLTR